MYLPKSMNLSILLNWDFSPFQLDAVQLFCRRKSTIALNGMKVCSYVFSQWKAFTTEHIP